MQIETLPETSTNRLSDTSGRTVGDIVRANTLTRFNALLGTLLLAILVVGPIQDAVFGVVIIANTAIGIVQELRVKRALDRLKVLVGGQARVRRAAAALEVGPDEILIGDLVEIRPGEQVLVDGDMVTSAGLEVNEALITGEAQPVPKATGAPMLSGSFAVAGSGTYLATRVGRDRYADRLVAEARRFQPATSELRAGINRMLAMIAVIAIPVGGLLIRSQAISNPRIADAVRASVAGLVTMVPEGLVLLTSIALAVGVLRLARDGTLVQELASIEALARADIVFVDKTGTITDGTVVLAGIDVLSGDRPRIERVLSAFAATATEDPDLRAIAGGITAAPLPVSKSMPFSSERRWAAIRVEDGTEWKLGAPEVVLGDASSLEQALNLADQGFRVLALAGTGDGTALVNLHERLRPDARETFDYLSRQGVAVKVLSGDSPSTVAAVARQAGIAAGEPLDARELDPGASDLVERVMRTSVFGRVGPGPKRDIVARMRKAGHVVAMVGDGVNDVLAIKEADIGVAMLSAAPACRGVAQIVVTRRGFAVLPEVIAEGRRVIANVERLASLFLTKTVYALAIALTAGILLDPFPFLPRHLTLVGAFTIGIPAFFLALEHNDARPAPGFVTRTLRFAIPAGLVAALATYVAYELAAEDVSLDSARTTAALVLSGVALWLLSILARPLSRRRWALLAAMVTGVVLTFALPVTRTFFALSSPPAIVWLAGIGIVALTGAALEAAAWGSGLVARVLARTPSRGGS